MGRSIILGVVGDSAAGKTTLTIAGWKQSAPTQIEVLYSMQTEGGPSSPWPTTAIAQKHDDGHWYASAQYACGISGLASGACFRPIEPGAVTSP